MFISLMTEQTEATDIEMNMRNINVITARAVPDKNVSDDFMHAVLSNCTTRIVLPVPKICSPESLPRNFNIAAAGVMKKGMLMGLFFFSGAYCAHRTIRWRKICFGERTNQQNYSGI